MTNDMNNSLNKNEISAGGKFFAGFLLILFILLPVFFIIGLWPDRMPAADEKGWYAGRLFALRLAATGKIHINTILFLLVALSGFLGCMIHVASSFVSYVGCEKLKRSWLLWYFVKPFTGAAIGIIFFFVVKAGILNFNGAEAANPYGLVMLAILAGLFTDKATLKLEEIFTALFHPKDERTDKIDESSVKVTGFEPSAITIGEDNTIVVKGSGFDKSAIVIKINDVNVPIAETKSDTVTFKYRVPELLVKEPALQLQIIDDKGRELHKGQLQVIGKTTADKGADASTNALLSGVLMEDENEIDAEDFVKG